jgi:hypothetical protein
MRILVIDDIRDVAAAPTEEVVYARTSKAAMGLLADGPWDVLVLDHDLGPGDDVRRVVAVLEERALKGNPIPIGEVVVVTRNPAGAQWIEAGLGRHYRLRRIPFAGTLVTL